MNNINNQLKKYKVSICKENYFLISDESEEHIIQSIELLNNYLKNITDKIPNLELKKVAILAAIQFASKLLKSTQELDHIKIHSEQLTSFIDVSTAQIEKFEKDK